MQRTNWMPVVGMALGLLSGGLCSYFGMKTTVACQEVRLDLISQRVSDLAIDVRSMRDTDIRELRSKMEVLIGKVSRGVGLEPDGGDEANQGRAGRRAGTPAREDRSDRLSLVPD